MFEVLNKRNVNYCAVYYDEVKKEKTKSGEEEEQKNKQKNNSYNNIDHSSGIHTFQNNNEDNEEKIVVDKGDCEHYVILGDYRGYLTICDFYTSQILFDERISDVFFLEIL
jgi:hypothetical protein